MLAFAQNLTYDINTIAEVRQAPTMAAPALDPGTPQMPKLRYTADERELDCVEFIAGGEADAGVDAEFDERQEYAAIERALGWSSIGRGGYMRRRARGAE